MNQAKLTLETPARRGLSALLAFAALAMAAPLATAELAAPEDNGTRTLMPPRVDERSAAEQGLARAKSDWASDQAKYLIPAPGLVAMPMITELDFNTGLPKAYHGGGCVITQEDVDYRFAYNQYVAERIETEGVPEYARPDLVELAKQISNPVAAASHHIDWAAPSDEHGETVIELLSSYGEQASKFVGVASDVDDALVLRVTTVTIFRGQRANRVQTMLYDTRAQRIMHVHTAHRAIRRCGNEVS